MKPELSEIQKQLPHVHTYEFTEQRYSWVQRVFKRKQRSWSGVTSLPIWRVEVAPTVAKQIEVKYGNLGSANHYAIPIPVRVIKVTHIPVTFADEPQYVTDSFLARGE